MKRFYKTVSTQAEGPEHAILLDKRPLRTPAKRALTLPTATLAEALAEEWRSQGETIDPPSMPLTQLACMALDLTALQRDRILEETAAYGGNDLLCYRAERPEALRSRQDALWQPLLDWVAVAHAAPLTVTSGIMAVEQPPESQEALTNALERLDDFALTAVAQSTRISGSLVLALALLAERLDAEATFAAAEVDETYQLEIWGSDRLAEEARARRLEELRHAERFLRFLS
ncbi:MAG: ATP12 family protein [Pseudomonadota bacterium]